MLPGRRRGPRTAPARVTGPVKACSPRARRAAGRLHARGGGARGRRQRDRTESPQGADSGGAPGSGRRGARRGGRPARRPRRPGPARPRHLVAPAPLPGGSRPGRPRGPRRGGGRGGRTEPLPAPHTKRLRGSPPHLQHGAPRAFENHRTPLRRARHSPGLPVPPGAAAAAAAISSRSPSPRPRCQVTPFTWAWSSLRRAAPRLRLDPSRRRLRRLRRARLARSPRTARGNGAQRLGESHPRPRRPLRAPTLRSPCSPGAGMRASL
nr:translation initiation factor IF-2-like [Mirounga angustirostris]